MKAAVLESEGLYPQTKKPDPPLRNLALGILLQALRDIVSPKKEASKERELWRKDAQEWFDSGATHLGSLLWVCDVLELDNNHLRKWLHDYRRSGQNHRKKVAKK